MHPSYIVSAALFCVFSLLFVAFPLLTLIRRKVVLVSSVVPLIATALFFLTLAFWNPLFAVTQLFTIGLVLIIVSRSSYGQWRPSIQSWTAFGVNREELIKTIAGVLQRRGLAFNFYHNRFLLSMQDVRVVVSTNGGFAVLGSDARAIRRDLVEEVRTELAAHPFQQSRPLWVLVSLGVMMMAFTWWAL